MSSPPSASDLRRLALTPRWLGLLALAIAFAVTCVLLGRWQWDRTQTIVEAERAAQAAPVDVRELVPSSGPFPAEHIGRPVVATGTYDASGTVAIRARSLDGRAGAWTWTPLVLADGTSIGIVRGWIEEPGAPAATVPDGPVTVAGILHPDERFYPDAPLEDGTALAIDSGRLGADRSGFVVLRSESASAPAAFPAPLPVPQTVVTADVPFPFQNFLYAFQWWLFAAFGLAMWGVWLWREARDEPASAGASVSAP